MKKLSKKSRDLLIFFVIIMVLFIVFIWETTDSMKNISDSHIFMLLVIIIIFIMLAIHILVPEKKFIVKEISLVHFDQAEELEIDIYYLIKNNIKTSINCLNILLGDDDNTTQIDNLVITSKAVYCIESKNYSGLILGNEYSNWRQYLNDEYYDLYSPIKQNKGHINFLANSIEELSEVPIINLVVFSNHCTLRIDEIKTNDIHVIKIDDLVEYIISYETILKDKLDLSSLDNIKLKLESLDIFSEENYKSHVDRINKNRELQ